MNKERFIEESNKKFGGIYAYSFPFPYKWKGKFQMVCEKHGEIQQTPIIHFKIGCPKCSIEKKAEKRAFDKFVKKADLRFGGRFSYRLDARGNSDSVYVLCPSHGEFLQTRKSHLLTKTGCPHCSEDSSSARQCKSRSLFEEKARLVHGDIYDYSISNYVNKYTKVSIICPKHGEFKQTPNNHLSGSGCPCCGNRLIHLEGLEREMSDFYKSPVKILNLNEISRFSSVIVYTLKGLEKRITVKTFRAQQTNKIRLANNPDYKLRSRYRTRFHRLVKRGNSESSLKFLGCGIDNYKLFLDYYDSADAYEIDHVYPCSLFDLSNERDVRICFNYRNTRKIGKRENLIKGNTIPPHAEILKARIDKLLIIEDYLASNNLKFTSCDFSLGFPVDILVADKNVAIKVYSNFEAKKGVLDSESKLADSYGVRLIQLFDWEIVSKFEICFSRIVFLLGLCKFKIHARDCSVIQIDSKEKSAFLNSNHLQGADKSVISYALALDKKIISCMTFCKPRIALGKRKSDYELSRFCSLLGYSVPGAASKLFSAFVKGHDPGKVISYSDNKWGRGSVYKNLGFNLAGSTSPGYFYYREGDPLGVSHRFSFAKHLLSKKFGDIDLAKTEKEICEENGYFQMYNSGNNIYEYIKN